MFVVYYDTRHHSKKSVTFMFAFCVTAHESIPMYTYFSKNVSMYLQIYTLKYILKLTYYIKDSCFKKKKSTQPLVQMINVTIWTPWCKHWVTHLVKHLF